MLFLLSVALKPVIFVPGTMASLLKGTTTRKDFWYCPSMKNKVVYFNKEYIIPPLYNCMFASLQFEYDKDTKYYKNAEGVDIGSFDWGGFSAFEFVDILPNHPVYTSFGDGIEYLKQYGYTEQQTLFGAAYDWRYGVNIHESYWTNLSALVEQVYNLNGRIRVALIGHSLGGFMVQQFLTKHSTPEWRKEYIDSAILCAPSFGGAGLAYTSLVTGKLPIFAEVTSSKLADAIRSLGCLHAQLPNHHAHGSNIIGYDANGNGLKASDFPAILDDILDKDLYAISRDVAAQDIEQPDVPTVIIYNSGLPTVVGYDIQNEKNVVGRGDLVVNAEGPEYACRKWSNETARIICYDFNQSLFSYNHLSLIITDDAVKKEMDYIVYDDWKN